MITIHCDNCKESSIRARIKDANHFYEHYNWMCWRCSLNKVPVNWDKYKWTAQGKKLLLTYEVFTLPTQEFRSAT